MKSSVIWALLRCVSVQGVKGVDNVYTQHKPLLLDTLQQALKGKLKDAAFPYTANTGPTSPSKWVVMGDETNIVTWGTHNVYSAVVV